MNRKAAVPMVCLVCKHNGVYYGRLVFPEEMLDETPPTCPNHANKSLEYPLTPAKVSGS